MKSIPARALAVLSVLSTPQAFAQTFTEGFENGSNEGAWAVWWSFPNVIETTGGNPDAYLRLDNSINGASTCHFLEIFPELWPAAFSGDWRAAGVTDIGLDVNVVAGAFGGEWSFKLANDGGTPLDTSDDCFLEYVSTQVPPLVTGWTSYEFPVPTASTTIPTGWFVSGPCAGGNPDTVWNQVIQDVSYFRFRMDTNPNIFCQFTFWDFGVDNIRVVNGAFAVDFCAGDGSGTTCPCGNTGGLGEGCANSSGVGATAAVAGSPSASNDDLGFAAADLLPSQPALLFAGEAALNGGNGIPFGDGLRCAGNNVVRLGVETPDGAGAASWGPGLGALGGWGSGDTRYFQVWYRDPAGSPCGAGFNLSHGVQVDFTP